MRQYLLYLLVFLLHGNLRQDCVKDHVSNDTNPVAIRRENLKLYPCLAANLPSRCLCSNPGLIWLFDDLVAVALIRRSAWSFKASAL